MHPIIAARTDFSTAESILTVDRLIECAKIAGATAVGVVDTMNVTALIDFTKKAKGAGMKPVMGLRLRLVDDVKWRAEKGDKKGKYGRPQSYLSFYILSEAGLKAAYRLLSLSFDDDHYYYVPRLEFDDFYKELDRLTAEDVLVTLGDIHGVIATTEAATVQEEIQKRLGEVYAAMVPVNTPYFARINELGMEAIARGAKPLTIRPAFYGKGDASAHEIMGAVYSNNAITDGWHKSPYSDDIHPVDLKEMVVEIRKMSALLIKRGNPTAGPVFKEGLANTEDLVDRVHYEWAKSPVSLPQMASDEFAAVVQSCREGWKERFSQPVFDHQPSKQELDEVYMPRLKYELSVLKALNFAGYFLLVQDVVNYAKSNGILVGPGRGSVGGSLVAYLMGITDCDPIRFGLLFERFINPDRIDLPDADLDFMSARRHEVVEYLVSKFGAKRVAGVSNYSRMQASSCIRDVAKVFNISEREYRCSKYVPKLHGQPVKLEQAAEEVAEIKAFADNNTALWPIMTRLEGTLRSYGQHAAGIVVGGLDLEERAVVEKRKEGVVVNWDKRIVEDQGLVKMDLLGLSTLDLIKLTLDYIRERHGKRVNLMRIPLDDKDVLELFAQGNTNGIFQFESGGMRKLLRELGSGGTISFEDITAATALYRPGPMESGMMDSYYLRKQGNEAVDYDHKLMEPILAPTYGVMVYQEQVMQVSRVIAGYSAPDADKLRKIMGKKLPEEMKKERGKFVDGCVKTIGCNEEWAGALFDKIEGFAGYGFNKSHSVEYTLISYQVAWLKTKYPVEFYAAGLSLIDQEKLPGLIRDAGRAGVKVSMPDINISTGRFEIANDTLLVIPFQRIKGLSEKTTTAILEARQAGPFADKNDFLARVNKTKCNIKHQTVLDQVGAFSRIEPGQPPSDDPSRIRDQIELVPGLVTATVPVQRDMQADKQTRQDIGALVNEYIKRHGPGGERDGSPVRPYIGKAPRLMIVQDCPGSGEDNAGFMGSSRAVDCVEIALAEANLTKDDVYWTALVKRPKAEKQISADEIVKYEPYLAREIELLKPPVIVLLGSGVVRHFFPGFKGKASDQAGKVEYRADIDANVVIGFAPGELYFAPEKQEQLNEVMQAAADLLV